MGERLADQKGEHGAQHLRTHDSYNEVKEVNAEEAKSGNNMVHWYYLSFISLIGYFLWRAICLWADSKKVGFGHSGENSTLVICQYE